MLITTRIEIASNGSIVWGGGGGRWGVVKILLIWRAIIFYIWIITLRIPKYFGISGSPSGSPLGMRFPLSNSFIPHLNNIASKLSDDEMCWNILRSIETCWEVEMWWDVLRCVHLMNWLPCPLSVWLCHSPSGDMTASGLSRWSQLFNEIVLLWTMEMCCWMSSIGRFRHSYFAFRIFIFLLLKTDIS